MPYQENRSAPGYWLYDGLPIQADVETHQLTVRIAMDLLAHGSDVLDVAAGHGALSKSLIDAGYRVACTSWNDNVDLNIECYRIDLDKAFTRADVGSRGYALVCALEIIEHVENPAQLLRSLASLLDEGGILVLSTPNVESAQARVEWFLRGCPYIFSGPEISENRHIAMLWRQGLEKFIELAGFDILNKHLTGQFRFSSSWQAALRRPVYWLMQILLPGDLRGSSRVYALQRSARVPHVLGAEEVA
ncbi:MAG: class I SAM-dependent methyltransferase [Burkholderiaceae bacterium]|nr:class I SAM-dependent methyltransferase [Burkholderiaceae bacterium]